MSYTEKRFLFWKYKSHDHEWEEDHREPMEFVTYGPVFFGYKELGVKPITIIYSICKECGEVKSEKRDGIWEKKSGK